MTRRITDAGAFYVYARRGIGERAGGATAYVALLAYNAATIGILGGLAFCSACRRRSTSRSSTTCT